MGGTIRSAWGSASLCIRGSCIVTPLRLGGGVGVGVGAPVAAKFLAGFRMASIVWAPKLAKGTAGAGFVRASSRRLYASVAASTEYIAVMAPLWGENCTVLAVCSPRVYGMYMR